MLPEVSQGYTSAQNSILSGTHPKSPPKTPPKIKRISNVTFGAIRWSHLRSQQRMHSPADPDGIQSNKEGLSKASLIIFATVATTFVACNLFKRGTRWRYQMAAAALSCCSMVLSSSTSSREVGGHPEAAGTGGQSWHIGLSEFMLWANHNRAAPPQGFRWLTQYSDRLAEMHRLAITPLVLCPVDPYEPSLMLEDAVIVGQGHRSLVVRLTLDSGDVVKISSSANIDREHNMHAKADSRKCQHLRAAGPGLRGVVEGAREGLSFIGLKLYCSGSISKVHILTDSAKTLHLEQLACIRNQWQGAKQALPAYRLSGSNWLLPQPRARREITDEASENIRTGPPRIDKDDRELDVWVGAVPLQQTVGNPLDDPKLRSGVPVP
ncbi:MAG: hypothetical protein FRX49_08981 [Trebouxia sp. A1-2]|nr:MAG: hypothetical protein FRX49_08981 [Trebouxia sp. A1-2]